MCQGSVCFLRLGPKKALKELMEQRAVQPEKMTWKRSLAHTSVHVDK